MRRVILSGLLALAVAGTLAGCSTTEEVSPAATPSTTVTLPPTIAEGQDNLTNPPYTFYVKLPNQVKVFCIGVNGAYANSEAPSSFSCDYANNQGLNIPAPKDR